MRERVLACLAPEGFEGVLRDGLGAAGTGVLFEPLRACLGSGGAAGDHSDPFGVRAFARAVRAEADGVLLVTPRRRAPSRSVPGPVVEGLPVGTLACARPAQAAAWLRALATPPRDAPVWAVLAMWRHSYLSLGKRFTRWLRGSNPAGVESWAADEVGREELCRRLATGPSLAVYLGHGRSRGFSGYHGLRWSHVAAVRDHAPCGVLIAFACSTLQRERGRIPFGSRWVQEGRAAAYLGSVGAIPLGAHADLAHQTGAVFAEGRAPHLGGLLTELERRLASAPKLKGAYDAFRTFRVIGNPLQPLDR